jgi:twitching motility protein PilT
MRDLETVDTSLKAAETGHLVYSSIHTSDVSSTISRLVSFFPPEEQLQVRARLAENLQAIISLRLLPTKKQNGRVPAVEVMRTTRSIRECIKDPSKSSEIAEYMTRGESMQTFDQHLLDLVRASKISVETALAAASSPADFKTKLALEGAELEVGDSEARALGPFEIESDERF